MKIQSLVWSLVFTALLGQLVFAEPAPPSSFTQAKDCAAGKCWDGGTPPDLTLVEAGEKSKAALGVPSGTLVKPQEKAPPVEKLTPEQMEKWHKFAERQQMMQTGAATVAGGAAGLMLGMLVLGPLAPVGVLVAVAAVGALIGFGFAKAAHAGVFSRGKE